ncbi:sodium/sugar symporter [Aquirufa antheringensis]|jgi:SSS family solute:Na+ symporter|uniref:Sodium transporter n=1 Tax=Aquirufa antheringensis TaxID=2516559 RepID=A0A4Q9BAR5_9BACT|nr:sodium/sugar symporter [Aquirufa antheringensis]MCE4216204.1 sodium/solute symporter [Pseudarcicella sp. GAP-15]MCZ2477094.1 sodium/solute symporter [Aquirufa antheringensis]MCZ2485690.1 sodium/solute symporter [Aquirufa antheringensis]MCZ2486617.1 sodium/solute symporter [Aquirufa antheringensis]MCZ2488602.1 sodium/solute symporter [Aquirufa antheringensis]
MQSNGLQTLDYLVFLFYFVVVAGYGYWIYNKKKSELSDSNDFFLAEGSLTWWAIGASLIASNISAEQFIGMSGNGFRLGLAIATYEWMAAATLLIVAIFFMPIYLKNKIFTMPQFLSQRYSPTVSLIMAVFWLMLYVAVNLTSILYLGALAVTTISGIDFTVCMIGMSVFAVIITLGGMKVIGFTDVIQVFFLILGGLATTYLALQMVSDHFGGEGVMSGLNHLMTKAPEHFHMILNKDNANYPSLPGLTVLIGGMWIINLNYWGCNQYITQRALGADLPTARNGILFAAFLKMLMPIIVVLPGIAAYLLHKDGMFQQEMMKDGVLNQDSAYPVLLNLLPAGLKGLSFAALTAAVVASMAGKANSISTIFTLDIYKKYINTNATEKQLVSIGRIAVVAAMVLAIAIAPFMGIDKKGGFEFIQEYTGYVSPGIFALFILGFFWKRTTSNAALFALIGGVTFSILSKYIPTWTGVNDCMFYTAFLDGDVYMIPFMDRMGWVFIFCVVSMVLISLADPESKNNPKGLEIDAKMFKLEPSFILGTVVVVMGIIALYTYFW